MRNAIFLLCLWLCWGASAQCESRSEVTQVPGDPLTGSGNVERSVLTRSQLFSNDQPSTPVDDTAGFAVPPNAAAPLQEFDGTLTLANPASKGRAQILRDDYADDNAADSPWRHLPAFSFQFVQNGSHLIPAQQGLVITGNPAWNYLLGPGRVWREKFDQGYMRASLPFALVERNQNCVHNGEMTFLFNRDRHPNISKVRYQVTQETCLYFKLNLWGQLDATYTPASVENAQALRIAESEEVRNRLPSKPFSSLLSDFPGSGLDVAKFTSDFKSPADITTYGLVINGIHYRGPCQTRFGAYAFCDDMRLPSYSTAKSSFAGIATMWLGQRYGNKVYGELIKDFLPQYKNGGDWSKVTFNDASDMATGNYISAIPQADEDGPQEHAFLVAETYREKIADAFTLFPHKAEPGTTWVYQTSATFILTQAMNEFLQRAQGRDADIFNDSIRDGIFKPLRLTQGSLTTLRTDNSASGKPFGGYGLFFVADDIAKIGRFLNNDGGAIAGRQVIDPVRLQQSLFRAAHPMATGVSVPDSANPIVPNTFRYHNFFWGKHMTSAEFPQYRCDFWVSFMSGYGGISVVLLPNGATYYIFSDGNEFLWYTAVNEINKIAPLCH